MPLRKRIACCALLAALGGTCISAHAEEVRSGRYQSVMPVPTESQRSPLDAVVAVSFPATVATVGQALTHVLPRSGYALAGAVASDPAQAVLLSRPLPRVHRDLGPMPLSQMLEVLSGQAWLLVIDPVHRLVAFELRPEYRSQWATSLAMAPGAFEADSAARADTLVRAKPPVTEQADDAREHVIIARGDTLSAVAEWLADNGEASPFQWMHALFEANRDSFGHVAGVPNMNIIGAGAVLRVPKASPTASPAEARSLVVDHYRAWQDSL